MKPGVGITLEIPDSVVKGMRLPAGEIEQRLRVELAVAVYAQGLFSVGPAAELAGMSRETFGSLLGARGVERHYTDEDLQQDAAYARGE